jgi:hypothetical protein
MIERKRVQQNNGSAFAHHAVDNLGVPTFYLLRDKGRHAGI